MGIAYVCSLNRMRPSVLGNAHNLAPRLCEQRPQCCINEKMGCPPCFKLAAAVTQAADAPTHLALWAQPKRQYQGCAHLALHLQLKSRIKALPTLPCARSQGQAILKIKIKNKK